MGLRAGLGARQTWLQPRLLRSPAGRATLGDFPAGGPPQLASHCEVRLLQGSHEITYLRSREQHLGHSTR